MMLAGTELQVLVARRPVDFRNYAERTIMRRALTRDARVSRLSTV
jgi:hypothetical protein